MLPAVTHVLSFQTACKMTSLCSVFACNFPQKNQLYTADAQKIVEWGFKSQMPKHQIFSRGYLNSQTNHTISLQVTVWYSDAISILVPQWSSFWDIAQKRTKNAQISLKSPLSSIQSGNCLVFRCIWIPNHSPTRRFLSFTICTAYYPSNTGLVRYSDAFCMCE